MPYTTETYQKAINILQHRRDNATLDLQQRTAEAQSKIPELADIQKRLSQIGLSISTLLFKSDNPQEEIEKLSRKALRFKKRKRRCSLKTALSPMRSLLNIPALPVRTAAISAKGFARATGSFLKILSAIR